MTKYDYNYEYDLIDRAYNHHLLMHICNIDVYSPC